ncbi:MAG TPA: NUDIX domain-containing protein [Candidatus Saccharimonadales bacterium]|nr:NUDIX domain-containing protein [Candidatus Saccharimonadales bacterium]
MLDNTDVSHHIQKYILSVLMHQKSARFRDLRPPRTDTNLFAYHLKLLAKYGLIEKAEMGYRLAPKGSAYVDRVNADKLFIRNQPKIITMLVIQNSNGDVLLLRRDKQPYIDTWTLPYGKLHLDDASIKAAAEREVYEKLGLKGQDLSHAGDCYIRVKSDGQILSSTLAHVFSFNNDDIDISERLQWFRPHKLDNLDLAPAVQEIMSRTFFRDPYFFEEFEEAI